MVASAVQAFFAEGHGDSDIDGPWRTKAFTPVFPIVPRATRGLFRATLKNFDTEAWMYRIEVRGSDGEHAVLRSYDHFLDLASGVPHGADLPPLPPKSFFRRTFSQKFMLRHASSFRKLLSVVLESDMLVYTEALAKFLAIGKSSPGRGRKGQEALHLFPGGFDNETATTGSDSIRRPTQRLRSRSR